MEPRSAAHLYVVPHETGRAMDKYLSYSALAKSEVEGVDYERIIQPAEGALVAVIAPHAGGIEPKTGPIAQEIAGADFSCYCFRGCKASGNGELHITSHRFDEPECVQLIVRHKWVVAIHGCSDNGERVFLGGLDKELVADLAAQLAQVGIIGETTGHHYLGTDPNNICNRGQSKAGAQFELSLSFRNGTRVPAFVGAVRSVLRARQNAA